MAKIGVFWGPKVTPEGGVTFPATALSFDVPHFALLGSKMPSSRFDPPKTQFFHFFCVFFTFFAFFSTFFCFFKKFFLWNHWKLFLSLNETLINFDQMSIHLCQLSSNFDPYTFPFSLQLILYQTSIPLLIKLEI